MGIPVTTAGALTPITQNAPAYFPTSPYPADKTSPNEIAITFAYINEEQSSCLKQQYKKNYKRMV
jgi:hypothetical protein